MKRRTLLKGALGLPLAGPSAYATAIASSARNPENDGAFLFSGLAGLDYSLGGIGPGEVSCVIGPPCAGKTLLLLDLAARICRRYVKNVVLWSGHQPSVYLARKLVVKGTRVAFAEDTVFVDDRNRGMGERRSMVVVRSSSAEPARAPGFAKLLEAERRRGCAALVMDGWSTVAKRGGDTEGVDGEAACLAERWSHTLLSVAHIAQAKQFALKYRVPVVMGVTTASLVDDGAMGESFEMSAEIRFAADRLVTLHRPELYVDTSKAVAADKNVVCLTGTSPRWWDTRCSQLRFDPRRLGFSTVV